MSDSRAALLHPFSSPSKAEGDFVNIVRAEGSTLYDEHGKAYIDGMASLWYCQVGHGRHEIVDAVTRQMSALATYNTFDPFTNDAAREVADLVAAKSPMDDPRVFLGCSGSEAVDTALKIARLVQQRRGNDGRQIIVRRDRGYHGTNFGGTSAQGIAPNREGWGDLVPHFEQVDGDDIEEMSKLFAEKGDRIAAVISEPMQGAGGVYPPTDGYLEGMRRLCDQHGALLIFDEVICGFGRTGEWFAGQTYGVVPDLMTFAKGVTSGYLPLSGVVIGRPVADELEAGDILRHGYTYSGHPAVCAAGVANLKIIEDEGLVARSLHIGEQFEKGFQAIVGDGMAKSYRGIAAVWGLDIGRDAIPVRDALLDDGIIVRGVGESLLMCPPLVITDDEIGQMVESFAKALVQ